MKRSRKYRIIIEDESHLRTVADASASPAGLILMAAAVVALFLVVAGAIIMTTPLRTLLPGYLKEAQRAATEDNLLRLDSLSDAYEKNQAYIDNFLKVTDTDRTVSDSVTIDSAASELATDSLMPPTARERRFVSEMEERERFNISVLAPLAADGMMFSPISDDCIFTSASKTEEKGIVLLPQDSPVCAVADGTVLDSYYSPAHHGYVLLLQHSRGFASRFAGLGKSLVSPGDIINAGQVMAFAPAPDKFNRRTVEVMMWHNGLPVIPYKYIGNSPHDNTDIPFEAPRGR